jgi:DNA-binding XRE family transcriptional regulator
MIHAYDKTYLSKAQTVLGRMLDYAIYDLKYSLDDFFELFIVTGYAERFENGDFSLIVGKSGVELARMILETGTKEKVTVKPQYVMNRSPEYWTGWSLAYYQWFTTLSFKEIVSVIPLHEIVMLYEPYHEMDIRHFCDKMSELYKIKHPYTNLKYFRKMADLTQNELAEQSEIPLRTIQQYEQRQKDINKAQAEYLIQLSRVLHCSPEKLIEKI